MKLSAECTSTSLDDEDHLVITIDVLTESILADPRRSGRLSGSSGLEGPRSTLSCRSPLLASSRSGTRKRTLDAGPETGKN
jgi:hypothetical protein